MSDSSVIAQAPPPAPATSGWTDHPVAILVAVAVGAAIAAGIAVFIGKLGADDEPPIRVKNGSIDFQLLSQNYTWEPVGGSDKWRPSGGQRPNDDLQVSVVAVPASVCTGALEARGKMLTIQYNDGTKIEIKSNSQRTEINPNKKLTSPVNGNYQMLQYSGTGFISNIKMGDLECTFIDKSQLVSLFILGY